MRLFFLLPTLFIGVLLISACANKPFQPIPPIFELWKKKGIGVDDVKKDLFACGFGNIGTGFDIQEVRVGNITENQMILASICMEKKGYRFNEGKATCEYSFNANFPACIDK